jgi:hypothetical protein
MATDKIPDIRAKSPAARAEIIGPSASVQLPAVVPPMLNGPAPRRWFRRAVLPLVLLTAATAAGYWWLHSGSGLPPGIAWGNGRLEADEIDICDPARVVFVASEAQFTPKTVETKDERDKLTFRIRVRIDRERLKGREAMVRSGLPGVAYVRTDSSVAWPAGLQPSAPPRAPAPS